MSRKRKAGAPAVAIPGHRSVMESGTPYDIPDFAPSDNQLRLFLDQLKDTD